MVPLAIALSRMLWSAVADFSISAHWARGMAQSPTYEYIGGFSETCATAGAAQTADIASAHSPAKTPHIFLFMLFDPPTKLVEAVVATTNEVQAVAHAHSLNFIRGRNNGFN